MTDVDNNQFLWSVQYLGSKIIFMYRVRTIPVLWYWLNTFLSNRAQYWADNSLQRRLATHDNLISHSSMRALA